MNTQLIERLSAPEKIDRAMAALEISKARPHPENIPALRKALYDESNTVGKCAAHALGKLGPKAREAVDDLIAAATMPWQFGCPQRFCDAISALAKIDSTHPQLTAICTHALTCRNYGIQKAAVEALARIASEEAINILHNVDDYRDTTIHCKLWDKMMAKILNNLR